MTLSKTPEEPQNESISMTNSPLEEPQEVVAVVTRDYSKLRKAAASQSVEKLKEVILQGNWTAKDIDDNDAYNESKGRQKQRQHASKSALHMAAWKGCLENVQYLLEDLGCDINAYSMQEFSYGKTAIFFALTQCRPDVTEYLLQRGAKVTIVNNKGQSVLSLAATHFRDSRGEAIVQTIQKLEEEQGDWWNFRATHSDGFEYGDLDPRFFVDRPLQDTDVVTPLAINPTSRKTRKGGFLRRNPGAEKWTNSCKGKHKSTTGKKRNRKKTPLPALSLEEQTELDKAWESLLAATPVSISEDLDKDSLMEILRLSDKQRSSWVPQATLRLTERFGEEESIRMIEEATVQLESPSQRQLLLLTKILGRLKCGEPQQQQKQPDEKQQQDSLQPYQNSSKHNPGCNTSFDSHLWKEARSEVQELHISCLEEMDSPILALPKSPIFVNTPILLGEVLGKLSTARLVAIDSEWHIPPKSANADGTRAKRKVALSTLQVAFWDSETGSLSAYVLDLMEQSPAQVHPEYRQLAKTFVGNLLEACGDAPDRDLPLVVGFAISHDLPILEQFLKEGNDDENCTDGGLEGITRRNPSRNFSRVLDLQSLLGGENKKSLPGLKACVANYSSKPLSKECQCSDWGMRPLSKAQLDYAGLDAAILLVLLAEQARKDIPAPRTE